MVVSYPSIYEDILMLLKSMWSTDPVDESEGTSSSIVSHARGAPTLALRARRTAVSCSSLREAPTSEAERGRLATVCSCSLSSHESQNVTRFFEDFSWPSCCFCIPTENDETRVVVLPKGIDDTALASATLLDGENLRRGGGGAI